MLAIISTSSLILPVTLTPSSIEAFTVGATNSIPVYNVIDSSGAAYPLQPKAPPGFLTPSGAYSLEVLGGFVSITELGAVSPAPSTFTPTTPITYEVGVGATGSAWNAAAVAAGGVSATVDTLGLKEIAIYGQVSAATNVSVNVSADGAAFFPSTQQASLTAAGNFYLDFTTGARYLQLVSSAAATITATISAK